MSDTDTAIPVHIYFVLDRSGSMSSLTEAVVSGFNKFVEEQKAQPGKCRLSMIQFDDQDPHEILYDAVKLADVEPFTAAQFSPRGMTPLLDAEGWMINRAKLREIERTAAGKKAEAILFVTFTDGHENASKEWTNEKLAEAKAQLETAGWTFTYLGVGLDNYAHTQQGTRTGTRSLVNNAATTAGVSSSYGAASFAASNVRSFAGRGEAIDSSLLYAGFDDDNSTVNVVGDDGTVTTTGPENKVEDLMEALQNSVDDAKKVRDEAKLKAESKA